MPTAKRPICLLQRRERDVAAPPQVDDPALKLQPGEGDRNAGWWGWRGLVTEFSEATEKGQEGARGRERKFRRILLDTLRKEEVLVR